MVNDAIKSGHAPALRTEAQGWDTDCALCDSKALALECSFCNHVYHNTAQCIKVPNIASDESMEVGAHWACPGCWKETCQKAAQWLLVPQQPVKHRRKRRRTQRIQGK